MRFVILLVSLLGVTCAKSLDARSKRQLSDQDHQGSNTAEAPSSCGGVFYGPSGMIQSPNYPSNYDNNDFCVYVILVDEGMVVNLTIHEFDVENEDNCTFDVVNIFDGNYVPHDHLIGSLCGGYRDLSRTWYQSTGNVMRIVLKTDRTITRPGFLMYYTAQSAQTEDPVPTTEAPSSCGGVFNGFSGSIQSPNYPSNYDNNEYCEYVIHVHEGMVVGLAIHEFDVENEDNCTFDVVNIFDGNNAFHKIGSLCGGYTDLSRTWYQSTGNVMTIVFKSDSSVTRPGFLMQYIAPPAPTADPVPTTEQAPTADPVPTKTTDTYCPAGLFKCPNSSMCIQENYVCDGYNDCYQGEDEINCNPASSGQCKLEVISPSTDLIDSVVCDDVIRLSSMDAMFQYCVNDCDNDPLCKTVIIKQRLLGQSPPYECSLFSAVCTSLGSPCTSCPSSIDNIQVKLCQETTETNCREGEFKCPNSHLCIPEQFVCNGISDCVQGEDEINCHHFKRDNGLCFHPFCGKRHFRRKRLCLDNPSYCWMRG